jgi:phenylacetate-coenzyme A ligase PaaK-like adenylate-forming protein
MDLRLISRVLFLRAAWRRRDHWDAPRIAAHQARALRELRRATYAGSEFYRRHHAGLHDAPLDRLPSVTKADLMEHFDEAVTTPELRLADLENHLLSLTQSGGDPGVPWKGRWWAAATAGTTGRRGTFIWDRSEWATVLASYARANDWAGISAGLTRPLKMALVSSRVPTHQSAVVGASLRSGLVPTLRLDVTAPMDETVAALNRFQPRILVGYASALKPLAAEQRAGRLHISPQGVMSASEVLTPHTAAELEAAWGSAPFDVYAATETAGIACGRAFTMLEGIEGRIEDVLQLPGKAGAANVHPIVFHHILDQAAAAGWQVIQETDGLRVLVAGLAPGASTEGVRSAVAAALEDAGVVDTHVEVHVVERVERTALGKAPFVRGLPGRR